MKNELISLLVDPVTRRSLELVGAPGQANEIETGELARGASARYEIVRGIPRFVLTQDTQQLQTRDAFAFKWQKRNTYDSPAAKKFSAEWCVRKYGFESLEEWGSFFNAHKRIVDVGCGSGYTSSLWLDTPYWQGTSWWVGVDISAAIDVAWERLHHIPGTHFVRADALQLPFADGAFDVVFSEGVLHHTPSTRAALLSAARLVARGGEFHFYIYRKKGPVREFSDDYIRAQLQPLGDAEAWESLRSLTKLGQALAELKTSVTVPEDVPLLGIKAGTIDVQRLLYWNFLKLFWNETLSFEENLHINFDWYRLFYAHRHTAEEIKTWCAEAGLIIRHFNEEDAGFSVRAVRE